LYPDICIESLTDWVQEALSTGVKGLRSEANYLFLFNAEIKEWNYSFTVSYVLMLATFNFCLRKLMAHYGQEYETLYEEKFAIV
jgi:hypothetical protein